jgi:hypothetical protein
MARLNRNFFILGAVTTVPMVISSALIATDILSKNNNIFKIGVSRAATTTYNLSGTIRETYNGTVTFNFNTQNGNYDHNGYIVTNEKDDVPNSIPKYTTTKIDTNSQEVHEIDPSETIK